MKKGIFVRYIIYLTFFFSTTALAYDQPAVNLGYTSFLDGSPPAGPGLYFQNYFQYYTAPHLRDNKENNLPLPRTQVDLIADIIQLIYLTNIKIGSANLGFSALLPSLLWTDVKDGLNNSVLKAIDGPGDLFIGPALQFEPIMRKDGKGPRYVQRIELDVVAPIGRYQHKAAINPSTNFWSLNPYWAATLWITPKWTVAWRMHYLWNAKNHDPNIGLGPNVYSSQAGQAIFGNFATEYGFTDQLHIGVNGYFFNQITDTKANGSNVKNRREQVWAIGPGALYGITKNQFLFLNVYFEQDARNRPQGISSILRYALHFN